MTITLTSKEFDEAVSLWLEDQGFSPDSYDISTKVIAGRSDSPLGTRLEITLDAKFRPTKHALDTVIGITRVEGDIGPTTMMPTFPFSQRASQGHADE